MPLVDHRPGGDDADGGRWRARTVDALDAARPNTVLRDRKGRRWVKQPRPFAVPWVADWRCTDDPPDQLWASAAQVVDVLAP